MVLNETGRFHPHKCLKCPKCSHTIDPALFHYLCFFKLSLPVAILLESSQEKAKLFPYFSMSQLNSIQVTADQESAVRTERVKAVFEIVMRPSSLLESVWLQNTLHIRQFILCRKNERYKICSVKRNNCVSTG